MGIRLVSSVTAFLLLGGQPTAAGPCAPAQLDSPLVVQDTAGALDLVEVVNCSGGSFDVEWVGSVIVKETIHLFGGTTLSITGAVDGTSVANGGNITSLFEVDGGTLHLSHLTLTNGTGESGGAIYATKAVLTTASCTFNLNTGVNGGGLFLDNTVLEADNSSFTDNIASVSGGAMLMEASNVTVGDTVLFKGNGASMGGALFMARGSILTLAGDNISIARNTATVYGGGLYTQESTAHLTGGVELVGNTAEYGGAIFIDNGSFSANGDMLLSNNFASHSGGALYGGLSAIDIAGTTVWENNSALVGGGGLNMWATNMFVQPLGEAAFIGNTAEFGGAAYISNSMLVLDGDVLFAENAVSINGGALYTDLSTINISGNALWENNRSPAAGGGL